MMQPLRRDRRPTIAAVAILALLAYVPALASSPGRLNADTKAGLTLNPGRLVADAPWTFDGRQFAGWVPHQMIAYLWPQGPWYWLAETVGLPDWVAQRLWIGTLFVAAGLGVLWMSRRLGLGVVAAMAAALVYQLSPYILPYVSRTSAMLLPWAALGWLVGLTAAAATRSRWRHAALVALVIATAGSINPTALIMVAPAPVLWLVTAAARRAITWRRAATTALTIGGLSLAVSAWWIVMVAIQGRQGADVLAYSESLESVSFTSTSTEVWRNLGYWLLYVRDAYDATTTAGRDYMVSGRVIATGFVILLVGIAGLVATRWAHRAFAVSLVAVGVVIGVGVHPIDDPSPLMDALLGDGTSGAALALRSSTRAVPMLVLGLGLGAAALVEAVARWRPPIARWSRPAVAAAVGLLAVANLPVLTGHRFVDPAIDRNEDLPAAWDEAVAAVDADGGGGRVLQLPGQEFGAFRWGYTVDPPLPSLIDRPLVTRDLLPLGSAPAMDLVYALDDRFQAGTIEPAAIAPVARLLGASTVWITGDAAFDRFRTPRPEIVHDLVSDVPGLAPPVPHGTPGVNVPDIPMVDEQALADARVGQPVPPVELVAVDDPESVIRAKDDVVVLVGSGDGVVDAAGAGLLDGHELVRYSGSLGAELADVAATAAAIIVTDSNRDRAHHWRSSQDVVGFTEDDDPATPDVLRTDPADERLPVFDTTIAPATVAVQEGPVRARATAYGEPFAYRPEQRPAMAIDGDPATAWVVGDRADPTGEQIRLDVAAPIDHLVLQQPPGAADQRHLARVLVTVDDGAPVAVDLDDRSLQADGQRVDITPTAGPSTVTITVDAVASPTDAIGPALAAVGFAEIGTGLGPTIEVVRPPADAVAAIDAAGDVPVSFVLTRLRTRPTDRWRADPEPTLRRDIELPRAMTFDPAITVRLDQRAPDAVLAGLLGIEGPTASSRLTGATAAAGWAATDGDTATAWQTPFGDVVGSTLDLVATEPLTSFTITQPGGEHSTITELRVAADGAAYDVAVAPPDADGTSTVTLPATLPAGPVQLAITAIDPRLTLDRRYAEPVVLPAAVSEVSIGARTAVPERVDTGCRADLLTVDGEPLPVRIEADVAALLAGDPVVAVPCDGSLDLAAGTHRIESALGATTGLDVDRVALSTSSDGPAAGARKPTVTVRASSRTSRDVTVDGCPDGCWLVLGEGLHDVWSASTDAGDLGAPQLVDGGFNGWWLEPHDGPVDVAIRWTAQRPLTVALWFSVVAVLACLALVVLDRRTRAPAREAAPVFAGLGNRVPWRVRWTALAVWVLGAVLLVGPGWGLVAAAAAAVLVIALGRPRLAGVVSFGLLAVMGGVVVRVVRTERPWPDAGWPVRFEWLHGLGLFAAVSLAVTMVTGSFSTPWRRRPLRHPTPAAPRPPSDQTTPT